MDTLRAVAKDIGRFLAFRFDGDEPQTRTERIAVAVIAVASFVVIFSLWYWG